MFQLFICLLALALKWVGLLLTRLQARLLDPGRQKTHEVLMVDQVSVLVHNCDRYDVIVCIDLVHQSTHHYKTLLRLYDLILSLFLVAGLWLIVMLLT